ncbi:Zinc finger, RING/FYVE/PHD-type [Cynara cardunculus var. scolymus]|uniref:RING-type E3 ubiquitin transferase n=1 Tax=Cynara cardunculus var. scolymus TaxID=59895 RepID=A0A118JX44_CYNCS|nr:Zinc finger, RING/FYVE/PHD-type [Cynara cardunculus var. scolymus]
MGGCCCCSSNRVEWNEQSRLHHYPAVSEERQPFPTGLLVDTNLDTSIPDTYRYPPAPLPYDANVGNPQSPLNSREGSANKCGAHVQANNSDPVGEIKISGENGAHEAMKSNGEEGTKIELVAPKEVDTELENSGELKKSKYDEENPKIITKCEHHFHLSCILEWMERSDTCPVCDQEMEVEFPFDD